ncbi:MAG: erythromycin esterase family protein [Betaproteobacteria bacterium]
MSPTLLRKSRAPHRAMRAACLGLTLLAGASGLALAAEAPDPDIAGWARTHLHAVDRVTPDGDFRDLEPLRAIIGDARIVSFGEGMHGAAEPLEFRNRLLRFLVERMGFTAIAIESGISEGFDVNRYVLGGGEDLAGAVKRGFSFGFAQLPQETELVRWMRSYNDDPKHARKIEFYGLDVSGGDDDMELPLRIALEYLDARDAGKAASIRARVADLQSRMHLNRQSEAPNQYPELSQAERDRLTGAIADLVSEFEVHETQWSAATSRRDYAVAYRAAVSARQVDSYLRWVPVGWTPKDGYAGIFPTVASADRTKADNLDWVLGQMGHGARVLVFMHRGHLMYTPSTIRLPPPTGLTTLPPMVGMYMKERYGTENVMIAHLFAAESTQCGAPARNAPAGTVEAHLAALPAPLFLLDLRSAPSNVAAWLKADREEFGMPPLNTVGIGNAYDAVFFSRSVTRAVACPAPAAH